MNVIVIESDGLGTNNQMRGIIVSVIKKNKNIKRVVASKYFLKATDGTILHLDNYASVEDFENALQETVDVYVKKHKIMPDYVLLPFNHAKMATENVAVDVMSLAVKKAFKKYDINIKTVVIASNLYNYQYVDLIHVGEHLLSQDEEQQMLQNKDLFAKSVITLGVPSNINWERIKTLANTPKFKHIIDNYRQKKNVLFSLGGISEDGHIGFDLKDAENLFKAAQQLKEKGYNVIFTNSPRTPSVITDYFFEMCRIYDMDFYNCKKVAQNIEQEQNFRYYSGKYKEQFFEQMQIIGNIYPAILDVCEFVINTYDSFSYTSDIAILGIASVVYTQNFINKEYRPDCYKLFSLCQNKGYVMDLRDALANVEANLPIKTVKMQDASLVLIAAMEGVLNQNKQKVE